MGNSKLETRNSKPEYRFEPHYVGVGGGGDVRMHYVDEGERGAPPVVMVHGNPTWSYYYRHLIVGLRGDHRVIVPDHVGMGLSEMPEESRYTFTLSRRVADLEALMASLKLTQPITLVVHDWGGMIGMAYAVRHPERIARIVVLNTGGFSLPKTKKMPWQLTVARLPVIGAVLVRGLNAFSSGAVRDCVMRPMSKETARGYLAPYDSWHHRLAVHRFIQDIPLREGDLAFALVAETERGLGKLSHVPMLICWGMHDFVFDVHFLNRWIELFPAAEVHRFAEAGHYVLEDAGEQILPLVQRFAASSPVARAGA